MILHEIAAIKSQKLFESLQMYVEMMADQKSEAHTVEQGIWDGLLKLGNALLREFFAHHGDGDIGPLLELTDGQQIPKRRLISRQYLSIFGTLHVKRMCYGRNEIEAVPLDAKLNLPKRKHSYLLQKWSLSFAIQDSYKETVDKIARFLHIKLSNRTLENMTRWVAQSVEGFQKHHPPPHPDTEGPLIVAAADGTRVPICQYESKSEIASHKDGSTIGKQKVACVGAVYTIEFFYRNVEDVIDEIMREQVQSRRPKPKHKRVQAHLIKGKEGTFSWMAKEVASRNPVGKKPVICLCDGEKALWQTKRRYLKNTIEIADIFHALEKIWLAAHCFHDRGTTKAAMFVEKRLRMLLEGKVSYVVSGLRQMATKRKLKGKQKKTIKLVTGYLYYNRTRMRYNEYLEKGYPIGSGAVEGSGRHLVKDRLCRTGMSWTMEGAQAMLHLRAVYLNHEWEPFWEYHVQCQHDLLYGHIPPVICEDRFQVA